MTASARSTIEAAEFGGFEPTPGAVTPAAILHGVAMEEDRNNE